MKLMDDLDVFILVHERAVSEFDDDSQDEVRPSFPTQQERPGVRCLLGWTVGYLQDCPAKVFAPTTDSRRAVLQSRGGVLERFTFADLRTSDDMASSASPSAPKDLGTIRIEFRRCRATAPPQQPQDVRNPFQAVEDRISEKCLKGKAISNRTELGTREVISRVPWYNVEYPWGNVPFATAIYKYRSRRDLQVEGIIPRSPSPVPLEERDPDSLSPEEARELVRRFQSRGNRVKTEIKKEKRENATLIEDDDDHDEVMLSTQQGRKRRRASPGPGDEVVDLSDD